jgi:hypothetical protein
MKTLQRWGGIAALVGAGTNLLGLVVFIGLLQPKGIGADDPDPAKVVALLADNRAAMLAWYGITYLVFGASVIVLTLALLERLTTAAPGLGQAVTVFGLIYATLVLLIGTLSIEDLNTVVRLGSEDTARAETVWVTLTAVEDGLGAGGGETIALSVWLLMLSWVALRADRLPRFLNYLGAVVGAAGVLSVLVGSLALMSVNGLGLIAWLVWLGIAMLRPRPAVLADHRVGDDAQDVPASNRL